jgi:phosphoglycolate phosphatase-like HAD superfamily hydrolase
MIRIIFFDFDLTLVDSRPGAKATYKSLWRLAGMKKSAKGFQQYVGSRFSLMVNHINEVSGVSKKTIVMTYQRGYDRYIPKMRFYGKELLKKLAMHPEIKMIILSNNRKESVKRACAYFKIKYDMLITDDDMAANETKASAISRTLRKLGLKKNEALYVGDHINDIKLAHKAGIKSVVVPTGVFSKLYLKRKHPDFVVNKLLDIEKIIIKQKPVKLEVY